MSSSRYIPPELTPMFANGRWRKPALSAMKRAALRKQAILSGKYVCLVALRVSSTERSDED